MKRPSDNHPCVSFLKSIYQHCDEGFVNLRFIPKDDTKPVEESFIPLGEIDNIPHKLEDYTKDYACCFGVATRTKDDGSKQGIIQIPALWCDLDTYKLTDQEKSESRQQYRDFPLKPTFTIDSGGGRYLLWMLKESAAREEISRLENLLKRFASQFHGDRAATDASRILRIPGSVNLKYAHHPQVKIIESHPEREYNLDDFEILAKLEVIPGQDEKPSLPEGWQEELLEGVSEGERNIAITKLAGRYVGKGLSRNEILPILLNANSHFKPPLSQKEVETCLDSILKTHQRNHPDEGAEEKPGSGHHFTLIRASDIISTQEPERDWVWEGILPSGGLSLIVAKPKIGKTTLALQLAVAVSRGETFLGRKTRRAAVIFLALEEHRDEVQKSLKKLGVTEESDEPLFLHFGTAPANAMQEIEPLIREKGAKFLVIDILQKFCRVKDLNDYSQVTRTLEPLMSVGRKLDCQISLTHHAGKADREDGDDILGSTGLLGGVDTSIHIKKRNKESRIFSTIQRYGVDVPQTVIALKDGCLVMEGSREEVEIEENVPLILVALGEGPLAEKDIWEKVGKDHSRVSSALRKLVEQKAVIRTGTGKRGNPFVYERDSLLLSSYIYEEGKREIKVESNLLESGNNISLDDFHKNQPPQERIEREIPIEKQAEEDPSKGGLYEVMEDGQITY